MTNALPNGEYRDPNTSAVFAIYSILRRQPWKTMAIKTWDAMKRLFLAGLLAASLGSLLPPAMAHARSYKVLSSYVPFAFQIGERTFKPGRYEFIVAAPGIVAMRDSRDRVIASITTRTKTTGGPTIASKLVFNTHTKTAQLIQIWAVTGEPGLDVMGEEKSVRTTQPAAAGNMLQPGLEFLMERPPSPGLKH